MKKHFNKDLSKAVDTLSAALGVAPNMLKALLIVSYTTVRRSTVDREDLEPYWKAEKKPHFSRWWTRLLFTSFSKVSRATKRRLTGR